MLEPSDLPRRYDIENTGPTMQSNAATDKLVQKPITDNMAAMFTANDAAKLQDPLANPLYADLAGLPPIYLAVGGHETLEDNVDRFAEKARQVGVEVEVERSAGMQHIYVLLAGRAPEADETIGRAGMWLQAKLGSAIVVG